MNLVMRKGGREKEVGNEKGSCSGGGKGRGRLDDIPRERKGHKDWTGCVSRYLVCTPSYNTNITYLP